MSTHPQDIYISSCASWLPEQNTPVAAAIATGEYAPTDAAEMQYNSIAIATQNEPMQMAKIAAQRALTASNISGSQLEMITYNGVHRHGHPQLWCPASYLQQALNAESALPMSIYQGCNGQLLAITMLAKVLMNNEHSYALSVAADQFSSGINRWHGDYGIVYGDAATAVVLSKHPGIAKILSLETVSYPALESLHRFEQPFSGRDPDYFDKQYNIRASKKKFVQRYGKEILIDSTQKAMQRLWEKTFSNPGLDPEEISFFIFPNLAKNILDQNYFPVYKNAEKKSLWQDFGRNVGHLGASDCIAGLVYLLQENKLSPGDKVLCIGAGSGFSWSFMLLEIDISFPSPACGRGAGERVHGLAINQMRTTL